MNKFINYYNNKALEYGTSNLRARRILELVGNAKGLKVLDIGCATGYLGWEIKKMGNYVVGVDISKEALRVAKKKIDKVVMMDVSDLKWQLDEKNFDLVISSEIIEHLFDSELFLKQIKKVLKKRGRLIITTPNTLYFGHRIQFLKGIFEYQNEGPFDFGHIRFFSYSSFRKLLKEQNFKILRSNHVYLGNQFFNFIKNKFPGFFAYQFVYLLENE